ncbi:uncharacterized protein LOC125741770 [Brienomyrus brachyistius]|uniref:uncharacterized protein LOC125741770 n=1 Tax=Brienomyrus brachyistius TaxID=42636 RepID=UPI0020B35BE4|nr:uncharacterized protein LOC125741770 [Brienomyrus brachyistius]
MTDAESLQQPCSPRSRWSYRCIVASIALLYLLFVGAAMWMLISMLSHEAKSEQTAFVLRQTAGDNRTTEKRKVFYLTLKSDEVKNKTMDWTCSVSGLYDNDLNIFEVPRKGNYLLGLNLVLQCNNECPSGSLKLTVSSNKGDHKTCHMELEKDPPSCIHMLDLPAASRLMVSMGVEVQEGAEKPDGSWKLDIKRSQWWIFISDE